MSLTFERANKACTRPPVPLRYASGVQSSWMNDAARGVVMLAHFVKLHAIMIV